MVKNIKKLIVISVASVLAFPLIVFAGPPPEGTGGGIDFTKPSGGLTIQAAIEAIFTNIWPLFEFTAVVLLLYAGILFLSANGDIAKISTARKALLWGIIGVIVGILAFSIPTIIRVKLGA